MAMLKSVLLLFMIFSMGNAQRCDFGWKPFGLRCYRYFSHSTTWILAERNCQSLGGNLASVKNKLQNDFLLSLLPFSSKRSWIGAHERPHGNGHWLWTDGSKFFYTNWCRGEPNSARENCMEINWTYNRCWNDVPCSLTMSYICAK